MLARYWLPSRWACGFFGDHQQSHHCLWFPCCHNVTHIFCPSLFSFCWDSYYYYCCYSVHVRIFSSYPLVSPSCPLSGVCSITTDLGRVAMWVEIPSWTKMLSLIGSALKLFDLFQHIIATSLRNAGHFETSNMFKISRRAFRAFFWNLF